MKESGARCLSSGSDEGPPVVTRAWVEGMVEPLTKFVFGYLRDRHATEDLVQEVFLKVLRNLHRYRGQASFKTWVFTIARNLCVDSLRASRRSRLRLLETLETTERDQAFLRRDSLGSDPGSRLELNESREQVRQALGGLSPEAQIYLVLRICQGLSHREIARHCGVKPTGVGIRISRALQGLSSRLP